MSIIMLPSYCVYWCFSHEWHIFLVLDYMNYWFDQMWTGELYDVLWLSCILAMPIWQS